MNSIGNKSLLLIILLLLGIYLSIQTALAAGEELTLDESIQLALANNPKVKIALAEAENAFWQFKEAKADKLPVLNYSHTASRLKLNPSDYPMAEYPSMNDIYNNYDNLITFTWPLYGGGNLEGAIAQADLLLKTAKLKVNKAKQQVHLDTVIAYYNLLQAKHLLKLNQISFEQIKAHLQDARLNYEVGTVAKVDVLRCEVELADSEQNLIKAQNNYDLASVNLNSMTGLPLNNKTKVQEELSYKKNKLPLDECIAIAMENRPEANQADLNQKIAVIAVKIARSGMYPTVMLKALANCSDIQFPGTEDDNWSLNLVAS
jgi:outer membrane protein